MNYESRIMKSSIAASMHDSYCMIHASATGRSF